MNTKVKTQLSMSLVTLLILTMMIALPITNVSAVTPTYVSAINADKEFADGMPNTNWNTTYFNYTNVEQPGYPVDASYPLGYLLVNLTVRNVGNATHGLRSWQVNMTWDPAVLEIAVAGLTPYAGDLYAPSDHVFKYDLGIAFWGKTIDNVKGTLFWGVALSSVGQPSFTGSGTMAIVKFNVTQIPPPTRTSMLTIVTVGAVRTKLITSGGGLLPFTAQDGSYKYEYIVPPPPRPQLEVYPSLVDQGKPLGPPILGTPKALFDVEIRIKDVANASNLILIQFSLLYNTTLLKRIEVLPGANATEGPFMGHIGIPGTTWAPYGTYFFTKELAPGDDMVLSILGPAPGGAGYNWSRFPDTTGLTGSQRVIATFRFESILQEEYPWTATARFDIVRLLNGGPYVRPYFYNTTHQQILHKPEINGTYKITGWILGRQIDVYTQYPYPYGGQGINEHSDMFEPQKTIYLYANVSYNADPVQAKIVTFQIIPPAGSTLGNFTRSNVTDSNGVTFVKFGIPWPCQNATRDVFGIWTVIAKVDIMCTVVNDTMQFKVNYFVMDLTVTPTETEFKKGTFASFNVTFSTFSEQYHDVLITKVVYDDLGVPVGSASEWITIGGVPRAMWCNTTSYLLQNEIFLPKYAFAGIGTVYVNALTNWPWNCGRAYCPEASATFTLLKYT